ncbi:MAG TPA: hypothetical protein VK775_10190 [Chthoniobacterales bacterium]|jgi:hypothetical protein|nr:hypothetical protein [Chthoniobacterales bacterium]
MKIRIEHRQSREKKQSGDASPIALPRRYSIKEALELLGIRTIGAPRCVRRAG